METHPVSCQRLPDLDRTAEGHGIIVRYWVGLSDGKYETWGDFPRNPECVFDFGYGNPHPREIIPPVRVFAMYPGVCFGPDGRIVAA